MLHVSSSKASITDSVGKASHASLGKLAPSTDDKAKVKLDRIAAPTDGGYGWFIVLCSSYLLFVSVSGMLTCGIFLVKFTEYFQVTKAHAAWIGSLHTGLIAPIGPFLPPVLKKFGCRVVGFLGCLLMTISFSISFVARSIVFLFISMGIIGGVAMPCIFMAASVSIQEYFDLKRATASSISVVGAAMGMFIWPPLCQFLINYYSWRGASLMMGAIVAHSLIFSLLLRPAPIKTVEVPINLSENREDGTTVCCQVTSVKEKTIHCVPKLFMCLGWIGIMGGHLFQIAITPIRAGYMGISEIRGAMLVSILGVVAGVLRPIAGWIGDRPQVNRLYMVGGSGIFCGIVAGVSISFNSFGLMIVYALLAGIGGATYYALQAASVVDVFGKVKVAPGFALLFVSVGIANVATVPIAGYLYDATESNFLPVLVLDCLFHTVGGVFICLIPAAQKLVNTHEQAAMEAKQKDEELMEPGTVKFGLDDS